MFGFWRRSYRLHNFWRATFLYIQYISPLNMLGAEVEVWVKPDSGHIRGVLQVMVMGIEVKYRHAGGKQAVPVHICRQMYRP